MGSDSIVLPAAGVGTLAFLAAACAVAAFVPGVATVPALGVGWLASIGAAWCGAILARRLLAGRRS